MRPNDDDIRKVWNYLNGCKNSPARVEKIKQYVLKNDPKFFVGSNDYIQFAHANDNQVKFVIGNHREDHKPIDINLSTKQFNQLLDFANIRIQNEQQAREQQQRIAEAEQEQRRQIQENRKAAENTTSGRELCDAVKYANNIDELIANLDICTAEGHKIIASDGTDITNSVLSTLKAINTETDAIQRRAKLESIDIRGITSYYGLKDKITTLRNNELEKLPKHQIHYNAPDLLEKKRNPISQMFHHIKKSLPSLKSLTSKSPKAEQTKPDNPKSNKLK